MNDAERARINAANLQLAKLCKPQTVFRFFAELSAIPRESGNVKAVADYLEEYAGKKGFEHVRDKTGNVVIRKKAQNTTRTDGVILQAHQDMVCVKNANVDHDFLTDPIEWKVDGDWLVANGTTLGADDGIGVALALAVLENGDMTHPPLEALFTVDEETDMKGAKAVTENMLRGSTLINLDAEDLGIAYVSSAAGVTGHIELPVRRTVAVDRFPFFMSVTVDGLLGGHSGIEINRARANAYVLLARVLTSAAKSMDVALCGFEQGQGGGADNAIPDRATAVVGLGSKRDAEAMMKLAGEWTGLLRNEYRESDPGVTVHALTKESEVLPPLDDKDRDRFLSLIRLLPLGVYRFIQSADLMKAVYGDLLVETSCNLGIVVLGEQSAKLVVLARGSTESALDDLVERMNVLAEVSAAEFTVANRTAGWEMPPHPTPVQRLFQQRDIQLLGVHAGLECGCLVETMRHAGRNLDAVSVGPDLKDVHSPKERLHTESVAILWEQLVGVLNDLA